MGNLIYNKNFSKENKTIQKKKKKKKVVTKISVVEFSGVRLFMEEQIAKRKGRIK